MDTQIMLYGHVNDRYIERLERIQHVTKMNKLNLNKLIERTIRVIQNNHDTCINKDRNKVRHVIRGEVHFRCEKRRFIIDISLLVTGTMIEWYNQKPKIIEEQYKDLYENEILKIDDKIFSIETLNTTIRMVDEELGNFSQQPTVGKFNFPRIIYDVTREDMVYMTEHMMNDKYNKMSKNAWKLIKKYTK